MKKEEKKGAQKIALRRGILEEGRRPRDSKLKKGEKKKVPCPHHHCGGEKEGRVPELLEALKFTGHLP